MAANLNESKKGRVEKKSKSEGKTKKPDRGKKREAASKAFTLLADEQTVDPTLSSLFAVKTALVAPSAVEVIHVAPIKATQTAANADAKNEDELSSVDESIPEDDDEVVEDNEDVVEAVEEEVATPIDNNPAVNGTEKKRKRKRKDAEDEVEDAYMRRLAREEEQEAKVAAAERAAKRQKAAVDEHETVVGLGAEEHSESEDENDGSDPDVAVEENDVEDEDAASPPPKHETEQTADDELAKANRTVFLGNVSTKAITSKSARKALESHLTSFFSEPKNGDSKHKLDSLRFRSTAFSTNIPKKAAFAKKELMDATTKSTNAYAVYSSEKLAREACKQLNATTVLDRHLRVDSVAHPAKVDHHRCVFVGNLGFVDDESNIQRANEEEGLEKRKPGKTPADIEEGLWRTFGRCGTVESVRVIRDSTTRVGKGIAYVQFEDENAVEAALLYNEKKFPPMLPRKLRVSRAKAQKRNAKPGSGRPGTSKPSTNGYQRKIAPEEASRIGRASKLLGRTAAAKVRKPGTSAIAQELGSRGSGDKRLAIGIRKPESFVFEGHRASSKSGTSGLKLGGKSKGKKGGKPAGRSAKRGAAFKAGGRKKKTS